MRKTLAGSHKGALLVKRAIRLAICALFIWAQSTAQAQIRLGVALGYSPVGVAVNHDTLPAGLVVELADALSNVLGQRIVVVPLPQQDVLPALAHDHVDAIADVTGTMPWPGLIVTRSFATTNDEFFRRAGEPPLTSLAQAAHLRVAAMAKDLADYELSSIAPPAELKRTQSFMAALLLLQNKQVDAVLCPKLTCTVIAQGLGLQDAVEAGPPLLEYARIYQFAVKESRQDLRNKLDSALLQARADGTYQRLTEQWQLLPRSSDRSHTRLIAFLVGAVGIIGLLVSWGLRLRTLRVRTEANAAKVELLTSALTAADTGVLILDKHSVARWANPAYYAIMGNMETYLGMNYLDILTSNGVCPSTMAEICAAQKAAARWHGTVHWLAAGRRIVVQLTLTPICDVAGHRHHTIWVLTDITELEDTVETLKKANERWQFVLEGAGQGFWDWCPQKNSLYLSPSWKSILGYADTEIDSRLETWVATIHPDDREAVLLAAEAHLRCESDVFEAEHRLRHKSGSYITVLSRGKLFYPPDDPGTPRLLGTTTDLSAIKHAEAAARYTTDLFHALVDAAIPDAMLVCGQDGGLVDASVRACALLGFTREELLQFSVQHIDESWAGDGPQRALRGLQAGATLTYDAAYRRKDGSQFPAEVRVGYVQSAGQRFYILLARDISARAAGQLAQELRAKELRHNEEAMRAVMDSMPIAVALVNELGIIGQANAEWRAAAQDLVDSVSAVLPEGENLVEAYEKLAATGDPDAGIIVAGIRHIQQGRIAQFAHSYKVARRQPLPPRWFNLTVSALQSAPRRLVLTHRETTDLQLALSRAQEFERMATAVGTPLFLIDPQLRYIAVNDASARLLGRYAEELRGVSLAEALPLDIVEFVIAHVTTAFEEGTERSARLHRTRFDGTIEVLDVQYYPVRDGRGNIEGVVVAMQEVTQLTTAHQALTDYAAALEVEVTRWAEDLMLTETRMAEVMDASPFLIVMLDADGLITSANQAFCTSINRARAQVLGQNLHELAHYKHPDGREFPEAECELFQAFKAGRLFHRLETTFWRADGSPLFVRAAVRPLLHEAQVKGAVVVCADLTIIQEGLQALRENEPTRHQFANSLPALILVLNPQGRVIYANSSWATFTGQTAADTMAEGWLDCVQPEYRDHARRVIAQCSTHKLDGDLICQITDRDGNLFHALAHVSPRNTRAYEFLGSLLIMTIVGRETME